MTKERDHCQIMSRLEKETMEREHPCPKKFGKKEVDSKAKQRVKNSDLVR